MRPTNQPPSSLPAAGSAGAHLPLAVLRQYVAGALPAAEQHRVERHTLACPRCADVVEGLARTDAATTDQSLRTLQTRLRARVAELETPPAARRRTWPALAAAALLLLLAATAWWGLFRRPAATTEGPAAVAVAPARPLPAAAPIKEPTRVAASMAVVAADTGAAPAAPADVAAALPARRPSGRRLASATLPEQSAAAARLPQSSRPGSTGLSSSAPAAATHGQAVVVAASAVRATPKARATEVARADIGEAEASDEASGRVVRGRVVARAGGAGLAGVQVLAKGTAYATTTAPDGSFQLAVPATAQALTLSASGYAPAELPVPADTSALVVTLTPVVAETPVLVRREAAPAPMNLAAMPATGQRAFRNYLRDSLNYPEKALKDEKEGSVRLSFVVQEDGSLHDIKVVRGLSEECDAEAIRLLKAGPAWHPAIINGRRTARPVQLSIPFRLADQR